MTRFCLLLPVLYSFLGSQPASMGAQAAVSPEVQALYERARAAQAAERTDEAVADYQKILRLAPGLAAAYNNLGRLFIISGAIPKR